MHVMTLLKAGMFDVAIEGKPASIAQALPDWNAHDRFGLVIDDALGGIGATHLLQIAMTAFYDIKPSRRTALTVYPEIYAFHIGKGYGAHAPYDFWPARREVITSRDHREILDAINDRGITRLAVPDRPKRDVGHRPKEVDAPLDRAASAFVSRPSGRGPKPEHATGGPGGARRAARNQPPVWRRSSSWCSIFAQARAAARISTTFSTRVVRRGLTNSRAGWWSQLASSSGPPGLERSSATRTMSPKDLV